MLKRKIYNELLQWKSRSDKQCLIVKGARQVGKTFIIELFAQENYKHAITLNFEKNQAYRTIFDGDLDTETIIKQISLRVPGAELVPNETLLFLDEIQSCPRAHTALKFLTQDGRFDVIASGSLLGINYKEVPSYPVGHVEHMEMHSLDFEEFLWAKGYDDEFISNLFSHMITLTPFSVVEMSICSSLFLDYCILGGMPAVVREYLTKGNFENSLDIQRQLIADYKEDIRKYAEGMDQTRILNVFNHIPPQLAKDNKKFQISKIAAGARFKDYRGCIEWLNDAGMINICYCLNFPELPLRGNYDETKYKIYFADSGLLVAMLDEEAQDDLRTNKNLGVYKGALYENFIGEALSKCGYELYYYKRDDSTLEEDFFLRTSSKLIPVEVKAKGGRAKSLRTLIDSDKYSDIHWGIKFTGGNIGCKDNVYTFPFFCAFLLKKYLKLQP